MTSPVQFGNNFILLDKIGTGGMAEIYRAKLTRDQGFEKIIVVKKLLEHHSSDKEMVTHFIDEARLAALLQHENIATIYDFGNVEGKYFIAMEYLFGKDLQTVLQKAKQKYGSLFPEFALFFTRQICEAMAYAHSLKDLQNNPLNIVHRDLTPQNIFVTYDGNIKILDFGIAKNELQETKTEVGVVKGKISYMSPEQLAGEENIDHRSDIFTIGIMLYEMLSGQKMYTGNTAELIKKAITTDYTPLQDIYPDYPPLVYEFLQKALADKRDDRYQNCTQMVNDLEDCLCEMIRRVSTTAIRDFMQEIFEKEYVQEQKETAAIIATSNTLQAVNQANLDEEKTTILHTRPEHTAPEEKKDAADNAISLHFTLKKRLLIYAGIVTLFLAITTFFMVSNHPEEPATIQEQLAKLSDEELENIRLQQKAKKKETIVKEYISRANTAFYNDNLAGPANSAFSLFSQALGVDPDNETALQGLKKVFDALMSDAKEQLNRLDLQGATESLEHAGKIYPNSQDVKELTAKVNQLQKENLLKTHINQAKHHIDKKEYSQAKELLAKAHSIDPSSSEVSNMLTKIKDIENAQKAAKNKQQLTHLQKLAEQSIRENRLTSPAGNCALFYYNEIKRINPKSPVVKKGYYKIADRYAVLADAHFSNVHLDSARLYVEQGLKLVPNHPRLLQLQAELNGAGAVFKGVFKSISKDLF